MFSENHHLLFGGWAEIKLEVLLYPVCVCIFNYLHPMLLLLLLHLHLLLLLYLLQIQEFCCIPFITCCK